MQRGADTLAAALEDVVGHIMDLLAEAVRRAVVDTLAGTSYGSSPRLTPQIQAPQSEFASAPVLLTVVQVAAHLGVSRTKVYELINRGEIQTVAIGRSRRIPADRLSTYIDNLAGRGP